MPELAEFAQLSPASLTRCRRPAGRRHLVHRKADAHDRRCVIVHITRRGRALQRRLSEAIASEREAIFADVVELRSASCSTRSPSSSAALR
jgi:DNA-binding MarR family transcriptional regulator